MTEFSFRVISNGRQAGEILVNISHIRLKRYICKTFFKSSCYDETKVIYHGKEIVISKFSFP